MIISPSQDSFFDSFPDPRDTHFPFHSSTTWAPPVSTHSSTTPTSHTNLSYRDLSSRVQVSKLIVSPSDGSIDKDLDQESDNSSPLRTFPLKSIKTTPKYSKFSSLNIETIAENEEGEASAFSSETKRPSSSELRQTQRQQMQRSLSMGMHGIMAKVISETKQKSPAGRKVHERSQTSPSQFLSVSPSLPSDGSPQHDLTIRNLVYSPLAPTQVNRTKNIPDFVFTPGPEEGMSDSEVNFLGSEPSEPMRSAGGTDQGLGWIGVLDFDGCAAEVEENLERRDRFKESERCEKIEEEAEVESHGELGKRVNEKQSLMGQDKEGMKENLLGGAEEDAYINSNSEVKEAQVPQKKAVKVVVKGSVNGSQSLGRVRGHHNREGRYIDESSDSLEATNSDVDPGEKMDGRYPSIKQDSHREKAEDKSIASNINRLPMYHPKPVRKSPPEKSHHFQVVSAAIHKTISPSLSVAPVSTVTAKKSVEAQISLPLKRSQTSEFKQTVQPTDNAYTLESTRSEPDFISSNKVRAVHDSSNTTSSVSPTDNSGTVASKKVSLRRSHTLHGHFSSVMRENRPHSIHYSNPLSTVAVDFTKDEIIRRAALKGMVRKPLLPPKNPESKLVYGSEQKVAELPKKDITTDLDNVAHREKKHHLPSQRRHSLFDMKSTTVNHSYVRIKDRRAVLDGSPPRSYLHQVQKERAPSVLRGESEEEGFSRPNSAPAKISKKAQNETT